MLKLGWCRSPAPLGSGDNHLLARPFLPVPPKPRCECHRCPFTKPLAHSLQNPFFTCPFPPDPGREFQARGTIHNSPSLHAFFLVSLSVAEGRAGQGDGAELGAGRSGQADCSVLSFKEMPLTREATSSLFHGASRRSKQQDGNVPFSGLPRCSQSASSDGYRRPAPSGSEGGSQSICQ